MTEAHIRIDDGIKRGPKPKNKSKARKPNGTFLAIDPELKTKIIEDAIRSLQRGESTDDVGRRHGVTGRAVRAWLIGDERAEQARGYLISSQLARTMDEIKDADAPLPLARAREDFRAWSWIAERRESRLYGQKQEITIEDKRDLGERLRRARERVIEGESVVASATPQRSNDLIPFIPETIKDK